MENLYLIIILLIILVVVGMGIFFFLGGETKRKQHTLAVIRGQATSEGKSGEDTKEQQNKRRAEIVRKLKEQSGADGKAKKTTMSSQLTQAGLKITVRQFWIFSAIFAFVVTLIAKFMFGMSGLNIALISVTAFLGIPRLFIIRRKKKRQKKFLEEFADALDAMVRLLKAGMPVAEAVLMASREFEGPVGEEMALIYDAQKVGISLADASQDAARRMPLTEMQMFATGISIQAQTGASLSEVLTNLSGVIRARFRLRRKVVALSSEAKSSAMIIGALPIVVGGGLTWINPEYSAPLLYTPTGHMLLAGSAVWMGIGILFMKVMINFKI